MRRRYLFVALPLLVAAVVWLRPAPDPNAYSVTQLVTLLNSHPAALNGRVVSVTGFYHHGCPYCTWDAPPSLTPGSSWGGPSIVVALPETALSNTEPAWITWWRTLPLLGQMAPPPTTGLPEGVTTFTGVIVHCGGNTCGGPSYVMHVLPARG